MSVAAVAISRPKDLEIPPEARQTFRDIFPHLTDEGKEHLVNEIMEAVERAQQENNLRPLQETIEAWYNTMIVMGDKGFGPNLKRARRSRPKSGFTVQQLRTRFGV